MNIELRGLEHDDPVRAATIQHQREGTVAPYLLLDDKVRLQVPAELDAKVVQRPQGQ